MSLRPSKLRLEREFADKPRREAGVVDFYLLSVLLSIRQVIDQGNEGDSIYEPNQGSIVEIFYRL